MNQIYGVNTDNRIHRPEYIKGFSLSPGQWSIFLYGDKQHNLSLEIIIDKSSTPNLFTLAIKQFEDVIPRTQQSQHLLTGKGK
jgi:hypothetical protein